MKSLMVGLLSAARFAIRFPSALLWAGGSSGWGIPGDCSHRAVDGSSHGALGGARRGTDEGFANRGNSVRNGGARLPHDRLLPRPRLRAHALSALRVGPLGVGLPGCPRQTSRAGGLLLCGRLLPVGGERLVLLASYLASLRGVASCSASASACPSPLAKAGARSSLRPRYGTRMSRPSLSSPLLIDFQERHLPRTVPVVFGRRPRPVP